MKRLNRDVGARDSAFQARPEIFDPVSVDILFHVAFKVVDDFVSETVFQIGVAGKFVGVHFRSRLNHLAHDHFRNALSAAWDYAGFHFAAALQHSHHNRFSGSALHSATAAHAFPFVAVHVPSLATDKGFIYFDRSAATAELGQAASLQSEAQTMKDEPRGLLSDAQSAGHFVRANPVPAVYEHPESGEPLVQSDRGILEDGAELDGELLVALLALPALLSLQVVVLFVAARGAFRAICPSEASYGVNADLLVRKVPDRGLKCLWLCAFHVAKVAHSPWLVK